MSNLLVFVLFFLSGHRITLGQNSLSMETFDTYYNTIIRKAIIIGGVPYNIFNNNDSIFCWNQCFNSPNISYPSSYDYPKISFPGSDQMRLLDFSKYGNRNPAIAIRNAINSVNRESSVYLDFALGCKVENNNNKAAQMLLAWNSKETFLIIAFDEPLNTSIPTYFSFGRGSKYYFLDNYSSQPGRYVFTISSRKMIRLGCLTTAESTVKIPNPLSIYPSYISNMGGERIDIQGPCPIDLIQFQIQIYKKDGPYVSKEFLLTVNDKKNGFYFIMPLLWNPGTYIFYCNYANRLFLTDVYVYSMTDFTLSWNNSNEMNSPTFRSNYTTLLSTEVSDTVDFSIITINTPDTKDYITPPIMSYKIKCINISTNCLLSVKDLVNIQFDINTDIGFFSMNSTTQKKNWSPPFSLVWLKAYKTNILKADSFMEDKCTSFLRSNPKPSIAFCPNHKSKVQYYLSIFKGDYYKDIAMDSLAAELHDQDCYMQMFKNDSNPETETTGVTCCYNKVGYLIYGQDFYNGDNPLVASYGWQYSPLLNPYQHFFNDRMRMISCCSIFEKPELCSEYWQKYNNVRLAEITPDYAGNVFGDPHFIPFHGQFNYSLLSKGEYWIIKSTNDMFNLQGRFYSHDKLPSILKGIAFIANSLRIEISRKLNINTMSDWSITIGGKDSSLPVKLEGITIVQSRDTEKLFIYTKVLNNSFVHMELSRFYYIQKSDEYMNLKIYLSSKFDDIVEGGLFGRIKYDSESSSLYNRNSADALKNITDNGTFEFAKTWQLKNEKESLFFYLPNIDEYKYLNPSEEFVKFEYNEFSECGSIKACNIDKSNYSEGNLWQETLETYKKRQEYNNNVVNASSGQYGTCDYPKWPYIKFISDVFTADKVISIIGCTDKNMKMKNKNQKIKCLITNLTWMGEPPITDTICYMDVTPSPDSLGKREQMILYIVLPLVAIIIIIFIVGAIIFIKRRQMSHGNVMKSEFSTTSQDHLQSTTTIPLDDVYDTWTSTKNKDEDEYGVYSKIEKPK